MNSKARQELIGIAALLVGFFLGLTLLPVALTGSWGRAIGNALWQLFGVGAIVLPILGVGSARASSSSSPMALRSRLVRFSHPTTRTGRAANAWWDCFRGFSRTESKAQSARRGRCWLVSSLCPLLES